ncbi:MAG: VanZ family protein [Chitinophagaceae bacterium]
MRGLLIKLCSVVITPVSWTIFTVVLLCLPGSAIPDTDLWGAPGLDKIVHVLLFGGIVLSWGFYYYKLDNEQWRRSLWFAAGFTILLGIILEFVQRYLIVGRSFDSYDIVADAVGALTATVIHLLWRRSR